MAMHVSMNPRLTRVSIIHNANDGADLTRCFVMKHFLLVFHEGFYSFINFPEAFL